MRFDQKIVEAKLALKRIRSEEMPALAWDALEAGFDGPSIRRLAALTKPSGWEVDQVVPSFMAEAELKPITRQEASVRLARQLARRILLEGHDPLAYIRDFELLWVEADYASEIQNAGTLDVQRFIDEDNGQTEAEFREYARSVLVVLVNTDPHNP
jgi:hypothetical protein